MIYNKTVTRHVSQAMGTGDTLNVTLTEAAAYPNIRIIIRRMAEASLPRATINSGTDPDIILNSTDPYTRLLEPGTQEFPFQEFPAQGGVHDVRIVMPPGNKTGVFEVECFA